MKKLSILILVFLYGSQVAFAQMNPLKGSGKLVNKTFGLTNFNKIYLADLDGEVAITAGPSFSIAIAIDDNLEPLLIVKENAGKLTVAFEGNRNNKRYVEDSHVKITITLPSLIFLENNGNANATVTGISDTSFEIQNLANGSATLSGAVQDFEIRKTGNGNVNAQALTAENASIKASGNGSVRINTSNDFTVKATGNGNISNSGSGQPNASSAISGNARFIALNTKKVVETIEAPKPDSKLRVYFINKTNAAKAIKIAWPVSGNYGNTIPANTTVTVMLPLGTNIKSRGLKSGITITRNNQKIIFE